MVIGTDSVGDAEGSKSSYGSQDTQCLGRGRTKCCATRVRAQRKECSLPRRVRKWHTKLRRSLRCRGHLSGDLSLFSEQTGWGLYSRLKDILIWSLTAQHGLQTSCSGITEELSRNSESQADPRASGSEASFQQDAPVIRMQI